MAKPKNKSELLSQSQEKFNELLLLLDSYLPEIVHQEFTKGTLNRNIRDVLAHLHEWHIMFLGWYEVGMKGQKPDMPAKGYTWKTLPELNQRIWEDCQELNLETVKLSLTSSYEQTQKIIKAHSNEELFEKKRYKWTGSTSLGIYLISNTSSHYAWAIKLIKKGLKNIH